MRGKFPTAWIIFLLLSAGLGHGQPSNIKPDQDIVFLQTLARHASNGSDWELEINGCVYEPEKRWLALACLRTALALEGIKLSDGETRTLAERARLFMVDHERGKSVVVHLAGKDFRLPKSQPNGRFSSVLKLSSLEFQALRDQAFHLQVVLPGRDKRQFATDCCLIEEKGITVISDIDDTIKITEVSDHKAMLRNTFLEPFKPVPGMAELYGSWAKHFGAQFWYVSASPWQLFLPLSDFVHTNGFPAGAFSLKDFRLKDKTAFNLFASPDRYKTGVIEPLLKAFPNRRFVLIGDSGEHDPEIYGALAKRYPQQVARIFIRQVAVKPGEAERYKTAFGSLAPGTWKVFHEPAELSDSLALL
jgi:hypothetical protein